MASHQLAIAKASFSAGLLRPDPTSVSRDDIAHFHTLLSSVVFQCTPKNVQKCKHWILENVQSGTRFTALGKYLTALTTTLTESSRVDGAPKRETSAKRRRLHLLYLVNDLLYHAKFRTNDASICSKVQPLLVILFGSAASFKGCPKHHKKISDLLSIWDEKGYYSKAYIAKLREAVKNASDAGDFALAEESTTVVADQISTTKLAKSAPFVMPAMHGDPSTPWYDLPAGNLMPVIEPNSTRPLNPDMIKPMQFVAGPASEDLVTAVRNLLDDVHVIYGTNLEHHDKASWDLDELGQPIVLDEITGDILEGEGYYGWSRGFCEKMKRRKKGLDMPVRNEDRYGTSRSRSSSPGRKRRYSDSSSSSVERHRPTRRRRSYSSSRSPSPFARNGHSRPRSRSFPRSSPRRSQSPRRQGPFPREQSPPPPPHHDLLPPRPPMNQPPPPPQGYIQPGAKPSFPPPPPPFSSAQSYNPAPPYASGPPQAHPQYPGQWAPPPPMNSNQQHPWPIPPPPPGPPPRNYQPGGYPQTGPPPGPYPSPNGPNHFHPPSPNVPGSQIQYPTGPPGNYPAPGPPQQGNFPPNGPGGGGSRDYNGSGNWQQGGAGGGWNHNQQNNGAWNNQQRGGHRGNYRGGGRGW